MSKNLNNTPLPNAYSLLDVKEEQQQFKADECAGQEREKKKVYMEIKD